MTDYEPDQQMLPGQTPKHMKLNEEKRVSPSVLTGMTNVNILDTPLPTDKNINEKEQANLPEYDEAN